METLEWFHRLVEVARNGDTVLVGDRGYGVAVYGLTSMMLTVMLVVSIHGVCLSLCVFLCLSVCVCLSAVHQHHRQRQTS